MRWGERLGETAAGREKRGMQKFGRGDRRGSVPPPRALRAGPGEAGARPSAFRAPAARSRALSRFPALPSPHSAARYRSLWPSQSPGLFSDSGPRGALDFAPLCSSRQLRRVCGRDLSLPAAPERVGGLGLASRVLSRRRIAPRPHPPTPAAAFLRWSARPPARSPDPARPSPPCPLQPPSCSSPRARRVSPSWTPHTSPHFPPCVPPALSLKPLLSSDHTTFSVSHAPLPSTSGW